MKRRIALLLALLLAGCAALGEETSFSFRNGVAWGMTQAEVLDAEGGPAHETDALGGGRVKLEFEDIQAPGAEADLDYLFINDALAAASYELDAEDVSAETIVAALDEKYGPRGDGDTGRFCDLMSALLGREYAMTDVLRPADFFYDWAPAGGTYIVMTNRLSDDGDDIELFYLDGPGILAAADFSVSEPAPALNPEDF